MFQHWDKWVTKKFAKVKVCFVGTLSFESVSVMDVIVSTTFSFTAIFFLFLRWCQNELKRNIRLPVVIGDVWNIDQHFHCVRSH